MNESNLGAEPRHPQPQVYLGAQTCEFGISAQVMLTAYAHGDATFSFYRSARRALHRDPTLVLDHFATRSQWHAFRCDSIRLMIRGPGLFGSIEALGRPENCSFEIQLWADSVQRADSTLQAVLADVDTFRIKDVGFTLNWRFLDGKGEIQSAETEERASEPLLPEAYPAIPDVYQFIEDYLAAPEAVILLQGPPGTGKTRLIRALLAAISHRHGQPTEVLFTGDIAVLESDQVYLEFIAGPHVAFVVEDADHLLKPRSGGNPTLHRFLNISDGIASAHGKKIIFSTNLPNIRDIDPALVRPGRCFAHLYLSELQSEEGERLLDRLCERHPERRPVAHDALRFGNRKTMSVAEVYGAFRNAAPQRSGPRQYGVQRNPQGIAFGLAAN